ncbi:hypothetical protein ABZ897_21685 [Nonomuraea sp. NPDC046802]|uniref:hypothetical protein n=1 Tax=Nonomuraea sp. NPDC046802 TaxID=3154919 RepID=UPI0033D571B7
MSKPQHRRSHPFPHQESARRTRTPIQERLPKDDIRTASGKKKWAAAEDLAKVVATLPLQEPALVTTS